MVSKPWVKIESARRPRWLDASHAAIILLVKAEHSDAEAPFIATAHDVEEHSRQLFADAEAGIFGPVAEPPPDQPILGTPISHPIGTVIAISPNGEVREIPGWPNFAAAIDDANRENANNSDRGTVVVWTSIIDDIIDFALSKVGITPANAFGRKIEQALAGQLIDEVEYAACQRFRPIRNAFAHEVGIALDDVRFAGECRGLFANLVGGNDKAPVRLLFNSAAVRLASVLAQRADQVAINGPPIAADGRPIHLR